MKDLSVAERIFIVRMSCHVAAGKSFDEAAQAVIDDDNRIYLAALCRSQDRRDEPSQGDVIVNTLCKQVYDSARRNGLSGVASQITNYDASSAEGQR